MKKILIANERVRVDLFISKNIDDLTREKIKSMIIDGHIKVNGKKVKPSYILKENESIEITLLEEETLKPTDLFLDTIYEDDAILVIFKPKGLVIHPSASYNDLTVVHHLLYHYDNLPTKGGLERPGIIHRLDKDTSGLLLVVKTEEAYDHLLEQFKNNTVKRVYEAICYGSFKELSATIDMPIKRDESSRVKMAVDGAGKTAVTKLKVINQNEDYSYLECELKTGRTHQIRVHLSKIGHPVLGDTVYGKKKQPIKDGQVLHAKQLGFIHPITNGYVEFNYPLPKYFKEVLSFTKLDEKINA